MSNGADQAWRDEQLREAVRRACVAADFESGPIEKALMQSEQRRHPESSVRPALVRISAPLLVMTIVFIGVASAIGSSVGTIAILWLSGFLQAW